MTKLTLSLLLVLVGQVHAAVLWTNPITGKNPNASVPFTDGQTVAGNLSVSGIGRGSGLTGINATDRYNAAGWNSASLNSLDYFYFMLAPASGYQLSLLSFVYTAQTPKDGPTGFAFSSSLDGFSSLIGAPSGIGTTISLTGTQFQSVSGPIEFRFYAFGADKAGSVFSINDFSFTGTMGLIKLALPAPVPESAPGLAIFSSCVCGIFAAARSRKFFARA